jgi:hypothetical protein
MTTPDSIPSSYTLTWNVPQPDPDNPATSWNLIEATSRTVGQDNLEGSNANRWTTDGWTWSTARYHSSNHSFYSGSADAINVVLISRRGHKVQAGEQLKFWTWYRIEADYDYGYVEVSTNGRDFTPIAGSITTNSDPNTRNLGNGITGTATTWAQATFSLSAYVGKTIWVRFRYNTDGGTVYEGWYVDDIEPSDLFTNETTLATGLTTPQYALAGHPLGTFYYLVQSVDADGDPAVWSAPKLEVITSSTDVVTGPAGSDRSNRLELIGSNPFSGSALLHLILPRALPPGTPLALSIVDVTGRLVASLSPSGATANADHSLNLEYRWSPHDLPAGVYLARMRAGSSSWERRLVYFK